MRTVRSFTMGTVVATLLACSSAALAEGAGAAGSPATAVDEREYGPVQPPGLRSGASRTPAEKAAARQAREQRRDRAGANRAAGAPGDRRGRSSAKSGDAKKADAKPSTTAPAARPASPSAKKPTAKSSSSSKSGSRSQASAKPAPPVGGIQLAPVAAAADAVIGNRTMIQCRIQSSLPKEVAGRNRKVVLADRPSGKVLQLRILEVDAKSGGFLSGGKTMTIEGRLTDKGKTVGTFTARQKSRGSLTNCGILDKAVEDLSIAIAAWLDKPAMGSKLGNEP